MPYPHTSAMLSLTALLLCPVLLTGCERDELTSPRRPTALAQVAQAQPSEQPTRTMSQRIAQQVPEFAGAHIDSGYLNVLLTDLGAARRARSVVLQELARQRRNLPIRFRQVDYSYAQLESFLTAVSPLGDDLVGVILYERYNRIYITFLTDDAVRTFEAKLADRGVPRAAFVLKRADPVRPLGTIRSLTGHVRPLVGGIRIDAQGPHSLAGSLGGVVQLNGTLYLVVSSHVVDSTGSGGTGQSVNQGTAQVGTVSVNPAFVNSTPNCSTLVSPSAKCRRADAALVALSSGVSAEFAHVAAPVGGPVTPGPASLLTFDDAATLEIIDDGVACSPGCMFRELLAGDTVSKVGMASGWTRGEVIGASPAQRGKDGLYRMGTYIVKANAREGDSGGSILSVAHDRIEGIQWGAGSDPATGDSVFLFSPWESVSLELAGHRYKLHANKPKLLGHEFWRVYPAECPSNPDVQDVYMIYGWITNGDYDIDSNPWLGRTTHYCAGAWIDETFSTTSEWSNCQQTYSWLSECPCADLIAGRNSSCPFRGP